MQTVKNQPLLARAFVALLQRYPQATDRARLVLVGEGPLRAETASILDAAGLLPLAWMPGARDDVAAILRMLDCFVLPSDAEGTSCTLQEAMSVGLPVVATAVGGTPELVADQLTGSLVPKGDAPAMAEALWRYFSDVSLARVHGQAARRHAVATFSLQAMLPRYQQLFTSR
jgi:glycosyltransferase involved in cell wall biosynthesis